LDFPEPYAVPAGRTAAGMKDALEAMTSLGRRLAADTELGPAEIEGYLPRGIRRPGYREKPGAERAVAMLVAKLRGEPFRTEIPLEAYDAVAPSSPVTDLTQATLGLVTTGAVVPKGNPDRLRRASETRWSKYSLDA